jgi:hypothetical protein
MPMRSPMAAEAIVEVPTKKLKTMTRASVSSACNTLPRMYLRVPTRSREPPSNAGLFLNVPVTARP